MRNGGKEGRKETHSFQQTLQSCEIKQGQGARRSIS